MMCYYLNVHFQGQRVKHSAVVTYEWVGQNSTAIDVACWHPGHS